MNCYWIVDNSKEVLNRLLKYRRMLFKCVVKCLRFRGKREIASLIFVFARGFTWFASGSLIYYVLLNAIVEKTRNSQLLDLAFKKRPTVYYSR